MDILTTLNNIIIMLHLNQPYSAYTAMFPPICYDYVLNEEQL